MNNVEIGDEMNSQLEEYLLNTLPPTEQWVLKMEKQAKKEKIPIMDPLSINFLSQLIQMTEPTKVLEIGTAIGYSALRMHAAYPETHITTIERDLTRYEQAVRNIEEQEKQNQIKVIHGDAFEVLKNLRTCSQHTFDFVLIDAAKSHYKRFFKLSDPLVKKNGVIVSDNVLFKGYVVNQSHEKNRYQRIVQKIRNYNEWLVNRPTYVTTIIPIGDGIAISYKKNI